MRAGRWTTREYAKLALPSQASIDLVIGWVDYRRIRHQSVLPDDSLTVNSDPGASVREGGTSANGAKTVTRTALERMRLPERRRALA